MGFRSSVNARQSRLRLACPIGFSSGAEMMTWWILLDRQSFGDVRFFVPRSSCLCIRAAVLAFSFLWNTSPVVSHDERILFLYMQNARLSLGFIEAHDAPRMASGEEGRAECLDTLLGCFFRASE